MSRHLRVLRRTGLVTEQELPDDARVRLYQIEPQAFRELRGQVDVVFEPSPNSTLVTTLPFVVTHRRSLAAALSSTA